MKIETYLENLKEQAQVYSPGRYTIFTKDSKDLTKGYCAEDIEIRIVDPPALTENMGAIWEARYKQKFPDGVKRAGKFPGMWKPLSVQGKLGLDLYDSGFLDWNLANVQGDEYDSQLEAECIRPPFNIHHLPITIDDHIIYCKRSNNRLAWRGNYLFTHSMGDDLDKNYAHRKIMYRLQNWQGREMFEQAALGLRREINPFEENQDHNFPNKVLAQILNEHDVKIENASCLTTAAVPKDMGYHLCFTARVNKEAGYIIEERNKYPMVGRIAEYRSEPFNEDSMIKFFKHYKDKIALTVEPTLIFACVQRFGEDFLKKLPYEFVVQR